MPLNAQAQELLDALAELGPAVIGRSSLEEARDSPGLADAVSVILRRRGEDPAVDAAHTDERRTVPGPAGDVEVRVLRPSPGGAEALPILVYVHGGGWVLGDLDDDGIVPELVRRAGCLAVSVGYRRAPEAPFPASHDDVVAALRWVLAHGDELGGDPGRVAVGGDSAGATMATAACRTLALAGERGPSAQLLAYPLADLTDGDRPSRRDAADTPPLTATALDWFVAQETTEDGQRRDPRLSPLLATHDELAALPPTLLFTAEQDVLRDEGEAYARALMDARVHVTLSRFPGMMHGFLGCHRVLDGADLAMTQAAAFLSAGFEGAEPAAQ
ncbi:acetyl esterase [Pseudonocardia sediminis]|uniref:Acetyl esterase n=1 Tax=Pseudonocardia sediminis TaxID=1397368 RepID=A0A4Q7V2K6_PSEST|nr:alpha/beta hydrolase [Pseudonocardia sediminis]RZT88335.1 acetyl esterase [Pseudonocardia sediminis]